MNKRGGWEDQSVHRRNGAGLGEHTGEARDRLCGALRPSFLGYRFSLFFGTVLFDLYIENNHNLQQHFFEPILLFI